MNLNNLNCVVTGASSGIGRELSLILAAKGCVVIVIARDREKLNDLVLESESLEGTILPIVFNLMDIDNYNELHKLIESRVERVDLLVNNAALGNYSDFINQKPNEVLDVIKTTLIAPILTTKICLDLMTDTTVVFVSSLAGKMGFSGLSTYSAAKHGIEGFADTLAQESNNIFIFRPGVTETRFFERAGMTEFEAEAKKTGLMKSAKEVANELIYALENDKKNYTVGNDKFLLPLLPLINRQSRFIVLKYLNKLTKIFG